MTITNNHLAIAATGVLGAYITYDILKRRKLDKALKDLDEHIIVDLDDEKLAKYVSRVVDKEVHKAAKDAATDAVVAYRGAIRSAVKEAVTECQSSLAKDVADEIAKQVGSLDISKIKETAVKDAKDEAIKALKEDFNDILDNYKENLDKFSVMYSAVAEKMRPRGSIANVSLPGLEFDWTV